jgi:hypothetical protein
VEKDLVPAAQEIPPQPNKDNRMIIIIERNMCIWESFPLQRFQRRLSTNVTRVFGSLERKTASRSIANPENSFLFKRG